MPKFSNLKSLYEHLEKHALDYKFEHQIGNEFQKIRDLMHGKKDPSEAERAQWEVDFFNFIMKKGELNPIFTGTNEKGESIEYASLDRFSEQTYDYLKSRQNDTSNPILKARYSHILWCSPHKHYLIGREAIDSYLSLIKLYEKKDIEKPSEHYGLDVLNAVMNAYHLGFKIRYNVEKIKSEIKSLVKRFNIQSNSSFALKAGLIDLMLTGGRKFLKKDFNGFSKVCWSLAKSLAENDNIHGSIRMLELGEAVDQKLSTKSHTWRKNIAESYEKLMKEAKKGNNLAAITFCQSAIENYRIMNNKKKVQELELIYHELKTTGEFSEFRQDIDLSNHIQNCREIAKEIVKNGSEEIIKILMLDKNLLPKYKDLEKMSDKYQETAVLQSIIPIEIIDQSGHPAQHFADKKEKKLMGYCSSLVGKFS